MQYKNMDFKCLKLEWFINNLWNIFYHCHVVDTSKKKKEKKKKGKDYIFTPP